jgi:amino acid permease
MHSVHLTFVLTAFFYFSVAFSGYATFGNAVEPNVLISLSKPLGVMVAANIMVVFHVLAGFHVYLFPLLDYIDGLAIKRGVLPSAVLYRGIVRSTLVLLISFVAAAVPFFEVILGFLGALSITPTTFIMPCLLWLKLKKPRPASWEFWFCWLTVPVRGAGTRFVFFFFSTSSKTFPSLSLSHAFSLNPPLRRQITYLKTPQIMTAIMFLGTAGAVREFIVKVIKDKAGGRPFAW